MYSKGNSMVQPEQPKGLASSLAEFFTTQDITDWHYGMALNLYMAHNH